MTTNTSRFTSTQAADGTVETNIDSTTGLQWAAKPLPERVTHQQAIDQCAALDLAGYSDWRLPTRAELLTLVDLTRYDPAIDVEAFPEIKGGWFWSSDLTAWSSASAWCVGFSYGGVSYDRRSSLGFALAVRRAGQ
ncbi:DUF1566 domain-containing protein [Pseudoxanthomonas indica]|uniref:Lcl C-terminal domain-containing protein n=1 Tax=Pseudoxanthomonas indica TaxID=428993 RepID=A0A1T5K1W7_9GAMM|nr:DUF1566 domain-containing protein [Pseudoxanthomonas indica]GGD45930.1 hypothetical protein GCM10007235_17400 [Pseudoxanthomonas indica]SKC57498.1 Protein of unknown function [Pseudoxanthomonas indica]